MADDKIIVGAFAGAFGVKGEVRIKSYCADPNSIVEYAPLTTQDGLTINQMVITGQSKGALTMRVDAITNKEQADALKGVELYANRSVLPSLPDDEFYYSDLEGLEVLDTAGDSLGTVRSVQNHGATDLLEIHGPNLKSTILLPFTKEAVPTVDLSAGRIIADLPEGLI